MKGLVLAEYNNFEISFTEDGWFNATLAAERFGKRPIDWLRLPETIRYLCALERKYEVKKSHFVKTKRGGDTSKQGTWLHPKLGVSFARWLDIDFAIWCDEQIDSLVRGKHTHYDWKRMRHEASSSFKVMTTMLQMQREAQGKLTKKHHFSNEARLINRALTGVFCSVDREALSFSELDLLAKLEAMDSILIGAGFDYDERRLRLEQFAADIRAQKQGKLCAA